MGLGDIIARLSVVLGLETAAFEKGATAAEKRLAQTQRQFAKMGDRLEGIGKKLSVAVTAPIVGAGVAVVKMSGDFEGAMNRVSISTQGTAAEMKAMSELALQIGKDTTFGATDAAGAMDMLAKNGLAARDILDGAAKAAVDLAQAGGAELAPAADAVTDVMQQFKIGVKDLPAVVNQITGAVNESKLDFDDFALAIGQAGGVAGASGVEFEDFNAAIAGTSSLFASGSDAGTSFKTFLTQLTPNSMPARKAIEELGLQFFDASGNMRSMAEIAQELQDKLAGLSESDRTATLKTIFGVDAMRTAIGLMDLGAEGIDKIKGKIAETDAAAQSAKRLEGFNGQLENLKGAVETLAIRIGQSGVLEAITGLVTNIADFVDTLSQSNPEILKWAAIIAGIVAVVGPVLVAIGAMVSAVATIAPVLAAVGGAISTFAAIITAGAIPALASFIVAMAPILIPIAAVTAAVLGVKYAFDHWDEIKAIIGNVASAISNWWSANVSPVLKNVWSAVSRGAQVWWDLHVAAIQSVMKLANGVRTWLVDKLGNVWRWITDKIDAVKGAFFDLYDAVVGHSYVPDMVDEIGQHMARLQQQMVDPARKATKDTKEAFRELAAEASAMLDRLFPELARLRAIREDLASIDKFQAKGLFSADLAREAGFRAMGGGREMTVSDRISEAAGAAFPPLEQTMEKLNKALGNAADKTKISTVRVAESFKDMADRSLQALDGMVNAIRSGGFLDILSSAVDLFLQLGSTGLFGAGLAKNINRVPAYAGGTNYHPGGWAMVGEEGPELVEMPQGSRVYSHRDSAGMMGGRLKVEVVANNNGFGAIIRNEAGQVVAEASPAIARGGAALAGQQASFHNSRRLA